MLYNDMPLTDQAAIDALAMPRSRAVSIYVECHPASSTVSMGISQHPLRERAGWLPRSDTSYHVHVHCVPADVSDQDVLDKLRQTVLHGTMTCNYWQLGAGNIVRAGE